MTDHTPSPLGLQHLPFEENLIFTRDLQKGTPFALEKAFLLYRSRNNDRFLRQHMVLENPDGGVELGSGEVLSTEALVEVLQTLLKTQSRFLEPHVLAFNESTLAWWEPSQKRPMHFHTRAPELNKLSGELIWQPPLLFVARKGALKVHALKENQRPERHTKLCIAPYMNMTQGGVCLGTSRMPNNMDPDDTRAFSVGFFASNFTFTNHQIIQYPGGYVAHMENLLSLDHFPTDRLLESSQTVKDVLR